MIKTPPHNRKLGLLGVALTKAKNNRNETQAFPAVRDEIEKIMIETKYLESASFSWVTVAIRYGLKNDDVPKYQQIDKQYGDLPLSIEVDTHQLVKASLEDLKVIFKIAVLKALIHAGEKYNRPIQCLKNELVRAQGSAV